MIVQTFFKGNTVHLENILDKNTIPKEKGCNVMHVSLK